MPGGQPRKYRPALGREICHRLAAGETLTKICRDAHMPCTTTVHNWAADDPEFFSAYARARILQAQTLADQCVDISDDGRNDTKLDDEGNVIIDHDHIQRSRLRVDTRKWMAAKLYPKKYGEQVRHAVGGDPDAPPIAHSAMTPEEYEAIARRLLDEV